MNNIARVFPTKTSNTPDDEYSFYKAPSFFLPQILPQIKEVHISVVFSWDIKKAEYLAKEWDRIAPVKIGGPALGTRGEEFNPGLYLKKGYVITSRGCPNKCWFCKVWKRDGTIRELPIMDGYNIQDDNLLACSELHIRKVFEMLSRQKKRPSFPGGLEAARLKPWIVDLLFKANPTQMFFAYDTADDYEPLRQAGKMLSEVGFTERQMRCFVLIGYPKDTLEKAEQRLNDACRCGFLPFAMLWVDEEGKKNKTFSALQRIWTRPAATISLYHSARNGI